MEYVLAATIIFMILVIKKTEISLFMRRASPNVGTS